MKLYYHRVRSVLACGLSLMVFVPTLAGFVAPTIVKAQDTPSPKLTTGKKVGANIDGYIIEDIDGVASCRHARSDEIPSILARPEDKRVPVEQILPNRSVPGGENAVNGLTISFDALPQLQADPIRSTVEAAFQRAALVWESRIKSPVNIKILIEYGTKSASGANFPTGVIGSTGSRVALIDYPGLRTNLLAGSSGAAETAIYNLLPASTVPTDTGNTQAVSVSRSAAFALGIPMVDPTDQDVAVMSFNKGFPFDFNPDNGISPGQTDFVAVAVHEIGHALGFSSGADAELSLSVVTLWDLFRFRPGMSSGLLPAAQRVMTEGGDQIYFTGETFSINGVPTSELPLSTGGLRANSGGDGNQSSHWKEDDGLTSKYVGIMDPQIASGVHEDPTDNDFKTIELLGWNLLESKAPPPAPPAFPAPANDNFANAQVLTGCSGTVVGANVGATQQTGEPNHSPDGGGGSRSVWFSWQAPSNGTVTFRTAGSRFDTVMGAYVGFSVGSLSPAGPNNKADDNGGDDKTSTVSFTANAGTTYRIAVDGYDNDTFGDIGPLQLNWDQPTCTPPATPPSILLELNGPAVDQAAVFDSILHLRDPFPVVNPANLFLPAGDPNTRVVIFVANLPGGAVTVNLVDSANNSFDITPISVNEFTELQFSQITFRLPTGLAVGTCRVKVVSQSGASNIATFRIGS